MTKKPKPDIDQRLDKLLASLKQHAAESHSNLHKAKARAALNTKDNQEWNRFCRIMRAAWQEYLKGKDSK